MPAAANVGEEREPRLLAALKTALAPYPPADRYLVGVSGGRDSVALLHGLRALGYRRLLVCHLDHGLRGRAGRADAAFVVRLATRLGLASVTAQADVNALAAGTGQSREAAGRQARYEFFARVAARRRCHTLFLGHHADDQVETLLLNLLRGTGPAGLAAMAVASVRRSPPSRAGRAATGELRVVRPLLGVWREEIDAYVRRERLRFREDASNADPAHTRNRLRAEVLPALERGFGRAVKPALWRTADLLGAEEAWWEQLLAAEVAGLGERLAVGALREAPTAKQRRLLRAWLRGRGCPGIGYREVEAVRGLLEPAAAGGPSKVNLPGDRHVRRRAGELFVETKRGSG